MKEKLLHTIIAFYESATPLLLITGASRSGKSALIEKFVNEYADKMSLIQITAKAELSLEDLLSTLGERCDHIYYPQSDDTIVFLNHFLTRLQRRELTFFCIIDDAHLLQEQTLKILLRLAALQSHSRVNLHILLVGESRLADKLFELAKQSGLSIIIPTHTIPTLTLQETERHTRDLPNDPPQKINPISSPMHSRIHKHKVKIASLIVLVFVLVLFWWWQRNPYRLEHPTLLPPQKISSPQTILPKTVASSMPEIETSELNLPVKTVKPSVTVPTPSSFTPVKPKLKSKNGYTLQLIGVRKREEVIKFLVQHHLKNVAWYFKTQYQEKPWYVVVYGRYSTREQAEKAIKRLPVSLQNQHPWVRSLAGHN